MLCLMVFKPDANNLVSFGASQLHSPCRTLLNPSHQEMSPLQHSDLHDPNPTCLKLCTMITGTISHQEKGAEGCAHISCPAGSHWCGDIQPTAAAGVKGRVVMDVLGATSFPSLSPEKLFVLEFIFFLSLRRFNPDVF